jgi:hypothetical protein
MSDKKQAEAKREQRGAALRANLLRRKNKAKEAKNDKKEVKNDQS